MKSRRHVVARPADLPIEQPTKFDLVINLKTAKALVLRGATSSSFGVTPGAMSPFAPPPANS